MHEEYRAIVAAGLILQIDDPRMADFVDNLGRVNAMADRMLFSKVDSWFEVWHRAPEAVTTVEVPWPFP